MQMQYKKFLRKCSFIKPIVTKFIFAKSIARNSKELKTVFAKIDFHAIQFQENKDT